MRQTDKAAAQRQMDAFAKTDSRSPDEQEGIGVEIIGTEQIPAARVDPPAEKGVWENRGVVEGSLLDE